jgi:signal transduction histidine kinase
LNETNHSLLKEIEKERKVEADRKTFISNVSHELKTPISISRGYLEAIKDQVNKEKHNDYIDIIYNENENMNEIVKGMLSLLKAESVSEYKMKSYEIKPILIELADYLSIQSSEKGQNFALVGDFGSAMMDLKSFKSIMLNLMTNAINYGVENSEIMIEGIITDKLQITISNHTENDVNTDELFTRFYTTDQSRNRKTSGTGLGLSIVRATLNKYNSGFNVRSEDGVFSFSFTLKTSD